MTERWVPGANVRRDLFGWCDLIVLRGKCCREPDCPWVEAEHPGSMEILGVQACVGSSHAARMAKAAPLVGPWLAAGGAAEVWSWSKTGARGKAKRWTLRREAISGASQGTQDETSPLEPWRTIRRIGTTTGGPLAKRTKA